jgi:hypothetical protein
MPAPRPSSPPSPLAVWVGLLASTAGGVRRAPLTAARLPFVLAGRLISRYQALGEKGDEVLGRLRGRRTERPSAGAAAQPVAAAVGMAHTAADAMGSAAATAGRVAADVAGGVGDTARRTADEVAEDVARGVDTLRSASRVGRSAFDRVGDEESGSRVEDTVTPGPGQAPTPVLAAAPEPEPELPAPGPLGPVETGEEGGEEGGDEGSGEAFGDEGADGGTKAAGEADFAAEADSAPTAAAPETPVPDREELPLADFDHMTLGSLRGRLRRLDAPALEQLLAYERAHAHRVAVVTMLENRLAKVGAPEAASDGGAEAEEPAGPDIPAGSSAQTPASPATAAEPATPAPHGVPGNTSSAR